MSRNVEVIYENGVLRPLEPLTLQENQRVTVLITESAGTAGRAYHDTSYAVALKTEQEACGHVPSIEELLNLTDKDTSSWADAITQAREERF